MIVEMRIYNLQPNSGPEVRKRFEEGLQSRLKFPGFVGYWDTDVGPLNQIIHVWQYDDIAQREDIRAQAIKAGGWPPKILDYVIDQDVWILKPAPFSPPLTPRTLGGIYEFRIYTYKAGTIPTVMQRWSEMIGGRTKISPLAGAWYSDIGPLNRWVHVWPYADAGERQKLRAEALRQKVWPPATSEFLIRQENLLAIPASFSPLK